MTCPAIEHHYRRARDWQRQIVAEGGGTITTYREPESVSGHGREAIVQRSYASAPYGEHALSAFMDAKRWKAFYARRAKG